MQITASIQVTLFTLKTRCIRSSLTRSLALLHTQ